MASPTPVLRLIRPPVRSCARTHVDQNLVSATQTHVQLAPLLPAHVLLLPPSSTLVLLPALTLSRSPCTNGVLGCFSVFSALL
jgi:hypothetical protein